MKLDATIHKTFGTDSKVRAIASIVIDDCFAIHGIKVIDSSRARFVAMPSNKYKDEYKDVCHPINSETRVQINDAVLTAYETQLEMANDYELPELQAI